MPAATVALRSHRWFGNVRELMSAVRRAAVIDAAALAGPDDRGLGEDTVRSMLPVSIAGMPWGASPEESARLLATLDRTGAHVTPTVDALRVSRMTSYRMRHRHGIVLKRGVARRRLAPPRMVEKRRGAGAGGSVLYLRRHNGLSPPLLIEQGENAGERIGYI
jgi:hypothetical protein